MEKHTIYTGLVLFKVISFISIVIFLNLGIFLDITQVPKESDIIISLGGSDISRIYTSLNLLENHYSTQNKIIYFGTKNQLFWKIRNNRTLEKEVQNTIHLIENIGNMTNTMDELNYIDTVVKDNNYSSIIIVTSPPHSKRVHFMIENFTKHLKDKYIIVSSNPKWWNRYYYFLNVKALLYSLLEVNKIIYNYIKYSFLKDTFISQKLDSSARKVKKIISNNLNI